jgi:hypothetical protein
MSAFDMKKIKEILDENERLKKINKKLFKKIDSFDYNNEIKKLKEQNELLSKRLLRFETIENQNIKDEIEKNKKEDALKAKKQINIDANKNFGLPIKKENEAFGLVTQHISNSHQQVFQINCINANVYSLHNNLIPGKKYDYCDKQKCNHGYLTTGYQVLWIPSTGMITHVFTTDQIKLPIKLHEMYNY